MHRFRRILRHTVASHPMQRHSNIQPRPHGDGPEARLPVKFRRIEQAAPYLRHGAVRELDEWKSADAPNRLKHPAVAASVNRPSGRAQQGVLQDRSGRPEAANSSLFLRPVRALEPIVETMLPGAPCTFSQEAMEHKEA